MPLTIQHPLLSIPALAVTDHSGSVRCRLKDVKPLLSSGSSANNSKQSNIPKTDLELDKDRLDKLGTVHRC